MRNIKYAIILGVSLSFLSCTSQEKVRDIEFQKIKEYVPSDLNTYGFVLPIDSKVPEVHQLANDLQADFFFYRDKVKYEKTVDKIIQLDPNYPTSYLMKSFYVTDTVKYKKLVTKAFELSKNTSLKSEMYMVQADYYLLVEKDYKKSQEYFQKVADMYPDSATAIWCVGMAYYYDGKIDKALECYKKSTELIPDLPKGYEFMAGVYYKKKEYKKALEYIMKAKKHGANAKNDIYFAEFESFIYYRNELYTKTIQTIEKAYSYGEEYRESKELNKAYGLVKKKLNSLTVSKS